MENIAVNIRGKTRRERLHGQECIVAPMTLIVPGVLDGSKGPLYYPKEEIEREPSVWNNVPIVVYHPKVNGEHVSARDPDILNQSQIGSVMRASANGKLVAEGWFNVKRTGEVDRRILSALESGQPIEISTGLFTDNEPVENQEFNGQAYDAIARNYRPDHLAILPDQKGACSIDDGCGVLNKLKSRKRKKKMPLSSTRRAEIIDNLIANCDCWDEEDREVLNEFEDGKISKLGAQQQRESADAGKVKKAEAVANAAKKGFTDPGGNEYTWNEDSNEWEPKKKSTTNGGGEKKPQTADEWFDTAPPEIRTAVQNAMSIENGEKKQLIDRLIANKEGDEKERLQKFFGDKTLVELRDIVSVMPTPAHEPVSVPHYFASASPVGNVTEDDLDEDDNLPLPTMNWDTK